MNLDPVFDFEQPPMNYSKFNFSELKSSPIVRTNWRIWRAAVTCPTEKEHRWRPVGPLMAGPLPT